MRIRDPIHGPLPVLDQEKSIISDAFFSRLRNIKQLGFTEYIFPGATHTRFLHSIGVMHVGTRAFDHLFSSFDRLDEVKKLRETFRLACLLHDIGHAPLSHTTESAMPPLKDLELPASFLKHEDDLSRQAIHEDYTVKAITDSSFASCFKDVEKDFKVERKCIADLIVGRTDDPGYFSIDGINYFPLLSQLISSEMDCDRMDYLLRDSYYCGVSYGQYDLPWLLDNLRCCPEGNKAYLGISERALVTFDDFLIGRYHMFLMVYFHYRPVCLQKLLERYFESSPDEYNLPPSIEEYIEHDDHYLKKVLIKSRNSYASDLINNRIPPKIFETFNEHQRKKLDVMEKYLKEQGIDYIRCSSEGKLSKYYNKKNHGNHIRVVHNNFGDKSFSNIEDSTKLFRRFSKAHVIERMHCHLDQLSSQSKNNLMDIINENE